MVFLTEEDILSKKNKREILVVHNAQVFFHDLVDIMSSKYGEKTKAKLETFMEYFFRHLGGDIDIRFLHMGEKHIVSIPEGRIIYYTASKKIRVYLKDKNE